jgi:hypothetical protein
MVLWLKNEMSILWLGEPKRYTKPCEFWHVWGTAHKDKEDLKLTVRTWIARKTKRHVYQPTVNQNLRIIVDDIKQPSSFCVGMNIKNIRFL